MGVGVAWGWRGGGVSWGVGLECWVYMWLLVWGVGVGGRRVLGGQRGAAGRVKCYLDKECLLRKGAIGQRRVLVFRDDQHWTPLHLWVSGRSDACVSSHVPRQAIHLCIHVAQPLSSPPLLNVLANGREEWEVTRGLARRLEGARPRLESDGLALQPRSSAGGALSRTVCVARALSQPRVALRLTARAERNAAALGVPAAPGTRICAGPGPSPWGFCRNTINEGHGVLSKTAPPPPPPPPQHSSRRKWQRARLLRSAPRWRRRWWGQRRSSRRCRWDLNRRRSRLPLWDSP